MPQNRVTYPNSTNLNAAQAIPKIVEGKERAIPSAAIQFFGIFIDLSFSSHSAFVYGLESIL